MVLILNIQRFLTATIIITLIAIVIESHKKRYTLQFLNDPIYYTKD
mgnify:CR=1 FL=1